MLCLLPLSYEHFVITLLYDRDTISMEDVKSNLYSKVLRKKVSGEGEVHAGGLVARGRTVEWDEGNRGGSRSQSQNRKKVTSFYCKKRGRVKKDCPCMKDKET